MDSSLLIRLLGHHAALIFGDTSVHDRWLWLRRRLPRTRNDEAIVLPLRPLPILLDRPIAALRRRPSFSICLEAYKPRLGHAALEARTAVSCGGAP